ncbi:MAG TPA: hypothetical protein VFA33_04995 [Bryobacteraceae bacterium]|nr:hypothetical protein [Bryobacteraceae bacterium]
MNEPLCLYCKKPFVAHHNVALWSRNKTVASKVCPDCAANMGAKPDVDLDCHEYMARHRVGTRIRDGYRMLLEAER